MTRVRAALLLACSYAGLTLVFTHPIAWRLTSHHAGEAGGDAKIYLWGYWWAREALSSGSNPFATDAIFHPLGIGLALHTLGFAQGLVFTPLSAVMGDVGAANAVVLWTFVASALATYALARRVGARPLPAFLAGFLFAFCPYRMARLSGHYDLLGTEWIPLYALLLIEIARRPRFPLALVLVAGAVAAAAGYTAATYLVFLGLLTVVLAAFHWKRFRAIAPRLAAVGAAALALLSPLVLQAWRDLSRWTYPPYPGADRYVADLLGYLRPGAFGDNVTETTVFAGYTVVATALLASWMRRRIPEISFWLLAACVFYVLSLGATLHVAGTDTGVPLPFAIIARLPLLEQLRAPSRFAVLVLLALAVVVARVASLWRSRIAAALGVLVAIEYAAVSLPAPSFAAGAHPVYERIASESGGGGVVEIPGIEQSPADVMYHQTFHERPVFVGTAARVPREKGEYYFGLPLVRPLIDLRKGRLALTEELLAHERASAPAVARFLGISFFVLDRAYEKRGVVEFVESVLPVERWYEDERLVVLRVRPGDLPPHPSKLEAGSPESRQHFESGWLRPEREGGRSFRWAHRERSTLLFRRPPGSEALRLEAAPLEDLGVTLTLRLEGGPARRYELARGWQSLSLPLPPRADGGVERLELRWSALRQASSTDERRLAARVRGVHFE